MAQGTNYETKPLLLRSRNHQDIGDHGSHRTYTDPLSGLSRPKWSAACTAIVTTAMFERLAYYGFTANMVVFLKGLPFSWHSYEAVNILLVSVGISYTCSVLGGWIADTSLGRFKTILVSFLIYICGAVLLVLVGYASAHREGEFRNSFCGERRQCPHAQLTELTTDWSENTQATTSATIFVPPVLCFPNERYCGKAIWPAMLLIHIGTGAIRSNLSPFGADQVKYEGSEVMRTFFNWFYWATNVGSFLAIGAVVCVQQNLDFFWGFLIPGIALAIATVVFILGKVFYITKRPTGSVLSNTRRILGEACRRRNERKRLNEEITEQNRNGEKVADSHPSFLDMAKERFGGSFHESMVEDVKSLGKIILVFIALIPYWSVYFQMQTTFILQGLHMKFTTEPDIAVPNCTILSSVMEHDYRNLARRVDEDDLFQIPAAWLILFDIVVVLIFIPFMERFIYPRLDKNGYNFSHLHRIAIGMVFSVLAMIAAGTLEIFRLRKINEDGYCIQVRAGNTIYDAADMWIFYQIPQYTLLGISEVFASVAGLELAYAQAPRSMQGLIMGLFHMSAGLGSFLSSGILTILSTHSIQWLTTQDLGNINFGNFSSIFFLFAGIQAAALVIFAIYIYICERTGITSSESKEGSVSPSLSKSC